MDQGHRCQTRETGLHPVGWAESLNRHKQQSEGWIFAEFSEGNAGKIVKGNTTEKTAMSQMTEVTKTLNYGRDGK